MITTPSAGEPTALAGVFADLSKDLLGAVDEPAMFDLIVRRAVELVPGCDHAGITVRQRRGRFETVAATDPLVRLCDLMQIEQGEGPSVDRVFELEDRVVSDFRSEDRWPEWASTAAELGVLSLLSVRLCSGSQLLGALNFFSKGVGTFDGGESREIATIFAVHATEALSKVRLVTGLQEALESRHTIGIAQGVLSQRYQISYDRAFDVMRRYSNDRNVKLRDIAASVLEKRELAGLDGLVTAAD